MFDSIFPGNYADVLADLKTKVGVTQLRAAASVNRELIGLYMEIGRQLAAQDAAWGTKVVEQLARDLKAEFPELEGFSRSNLFYMKKVFTAWSGATEEVQQLAGLIPWWHHVMAVSKVPDPTAREFYLRQVVEYGWSRAILTVQIESGLHSRSGKALTNFARTLPDATSDLAQLRPGAAMNVDLHSYA